MLYHLNENAAASMSPFTTAAHCAILTATGNTTPLPCPADGAYHYGA